MYGDNGVNSARGGRPTTPISSPNHILIIFSSEPHRNPRPFNINVAIFLKNVFIYKDRTLKKIILKGRGFRCGIPKI